jgi:serine/threonine protein kinase
MERILAGVALLHMSRIQHNDLKTGNIVCRLTSKYFLDFLLFIIASPKLCDFGISAKINFKREKLPYVEGTRGY